MGTTSGYMSLFQGAINWTTYTSMFYSAGQLVISVSPSAFNSIAIFDAGGTYFNKPIYSAADGSYANGGPSNRWSVVYAVNGTIQTSDANEKTEIANLDEAEKRVATRIKGSIKKFKFKDAVADKGSDNARIHVGVIAQEVGDAFRSEGLDPNKYGIFCHDEWDAQDEILTKDGQIQQPARAAGSRYGVRYDELLAFVIAAI